MTTWWLPLQRIRRQRYGGPAVGHGKRLEYQNFTNPCVCVQGYIVGNKITVMCQSSQTNAQA